MTDDFPVPDQEAAKYLVSCGLKGVGTDALSVDTLRGSAASWPTKLLLDGGLVILESLCLKKVVGRTDLMLFALPLKFENADGAPVRAIAEFRDFPEEKEMEDAVRKFLAILVCKLGRVRGQAGGQGQLHARQVRPEDLPRYSRPGPAAPPTSSPSPAPTAKPPRWR